MTKKYYRTYNTPQGIKKVHTTKGNSWKSKTPCPVCKSPRVWKYYAYPYDHPNERRLVTKCKDCIYQKVGNFKKY